MTTTPYCNTLWTKIFPFLRWWPMVTRETVKADFMAGLTGAVVVLPQGVAFAMIAGLPPVYGLYTAMVPAIIAGLFGSSRHLISGPTTAISIVVFAAVSKFAEPGSAKFIQMALTLTFLAGVYQLALGLARMGALVNFISHSVVVGFTAGAAVLIATSQLKHYFGMHIPSGESFLHTWRDLILQLPDTNLYVAGIATLTLAILIVLMKLKPRWPVMLIGMALGSLAAAFAGGESEGIKLVGKLPSDLPPLSMPDLHLASLRQLGSAALAVAMLGLVEAVSIARSVASKSGQRISGNQEFIGQGLANAAGSFFSSYASSGSFTRSGLNYTAGAVTPLSAVFAAVSLALIVLLVAPMAAHLPIAAMAAVLLVVAYRLIDFHHIKTIISTSKRETAVLATTFFATLFVELEFAIYVGVMLSLIIYLMRTAQPRVAVTVPDPNTQHRNFVSDAKLPECPQLKVVRIDGSIYFGAVDHVGERLHSFAEADPAQKHLLVVGSGVNFIDLAGAELLAAEARRRRGQGGDLYLAKIKPEACETLRRGGFRDLIGADNIFPGKASAIASIFQRLDHSICARCDKRIFAECAQVRPLSLGAAEPAALEFGTLPRVERLLVASDDSEYTAGAIHEALRIAKKSGARVRVIHLIPRASDELAMSAGQISEPLLARARTHLNEVEREAAAAGVACDTEVIHTGLRLYQEIVNQADQMKADLIVMGRRGQRGLARVLLGQATAKVIGHAHCAVLVVPRNAEITGQRLVLATDGSAYADAATAMAGSLAKILAAPVSALSVTLPSQSDRRHEEARVAANRAAAFLKNHELDAEAVVHHGRPDEVIVETTIAKKADLIVIGSHGRTGLDRVMLGSVSERVIDAASTAVLVARIS